MAAVMHDLKHGRHHGQRSRRQEVAIALKSAGMAKADRRVAPRKSHRRGTRVQRRKKRSSSRR
jgi:hypothetical protein